MSRLNSFFIISALTLIGLAVTQVTKPAHAFDGGIVSKSGYVTTRGLVLDDATGKPIYVEIMANGQYGVTFGPAVETMADAYVISADQYRAIVGLFDDISTRPEALGAYVLTRERYQNIQRAPGHFGMISVPVLGSETPESIPVPAPDIDATTKSVLIRHNNSIEDPRALPAGQGPILLEAPIDVSNTSIRRDLSSETKSVLMDKNGNVLHTSIHDIGFKSRFIKRLNNDNPGASESTANLLNFRPGDRPAGPVAFAYVDAGLGYTYSPTYTDANGLFRLNMYIPPCPGFVWSYDFNLWARLNYKSFDPEAPSQPRHYYFTRPYSQTCNGLGAFPPSYSLGGLMAMVAVRGIIAAQATPMVRADFFIDVVMLNGRGTMQNPGAGNISVTDEPTEYTYAAPVGPVRPFAIGLDLDTDNRKDWQVLDPSDPRLVNVYLGGRTNTDVDADGNPIAPDLQRLADAPPDFTDQGLLSKISKADLEQTDVYVYRVATGQLITKVEGLDPRQVIPAETGFSYKIIIPGPMATRNDFSTRRFRYGSRSAWQESLGLPEEMRGREADALRPGETVQIIAINRPTGYIGSADAIIQQAGGAGSNPGRLDFDIPNIVLRPPNLKIKVERVYEVQGGLNRGARPRYQVGFEGSALTSDLQVEIATEWFDHNGRPLPEDLEGYTGRLAKITAPNSLQGGAVATFEIRPGKQLQVLNFRGDYLGSEHFYVHVFGTPAWEVMRGAGSGPLRQRPDTYVPIKVPLYDEETTRRLRNIAVAEGRRASEVKPIYHWAYRPEMQYSVFELAMQGLELTDTSNQTQLIDLTGNLNPQLIDLLLSDNTDSAKLLYDLLAPDNAQLPTFGPDRLLVFSIGGEESQATLTAGGNVQFNNLNHLTQLNAEDYFAIRFYQNSDMANVLWEYNFWGLDVRSSGDLGSRAAQSFLIRPTEQAIEVALAIEIKPTDTIQWEVVALKGNDAPDDLNVESNGGSGPTNKPFAYGKTMSHKVGPVQAITAAMGINVNAQGQTQMGKYEKPWLSREYTGSAAKVFSFVPDMTDVPHMPVAYANATCPGGQYSDCLRGTNMGDVWRHNPRVGYKVTAMVNGQQVGSAEVRMDEIDVLRQEYINHMISAGLTTSSAVSIPERELFKQAEQLPGGKAAWVEVRSDKFSYAYNAVLNEGMVELSNAVFTQFATFKASQTFTGENSVVVTIPSNAAIRRTSSYRNPERNERVGGNPESRHMLGRAADIAVVGYTKNDIGPDKAKKFYTLWKSVRAIPPANADFFQMEPTATDPYIYSNKASDGTWSVGYGGLGEDVVLFDNDDDGVPDYFQNSDHMHIQDNP